MLLEISLALGVIACFVYKKLKLSRQETKTLSQILEDERSPKKFREKLKDYFEQEIKRTSKKHQELLQANDKDIIKRDLLLTRQNALNIEKKASQKNHLDQDYWTSVQQGYSTILPPPHNEHTTLASIEEEALSLPQTQSRAGVKIPEVEYSKAAAEELSRLHNVIANQYNSIDELKGKLLDIKDDEALANHPLVGELQHQISRLVADQEQMAMCVKVLESENERLIHSLEQMDFNVETANPSSQPENESELVQHLVEEQKQSENLIRDLLRTNKEQLQCIATLESELEMKHDMEISNDPSAVVLASLEKAKHEIDQLKQENRQHLQTIEQLQLQLQSSHAGLENSPRELSDQHKNLEKQLHAKVAELNLLREEYQIMHQKYIKLAEDKAS